LILQRVVVRMMRVKMRRVCHGKSLRLRLKGQMHAIRIVRVRTKERGLGGRRDRLVEPVEVVL
jgi:hypothetical protein